MHALPLSDSVEIWDGQPFLLRLRRCQTVCDIIGRVDRVQVELELAWMQAQTEKERMDKAEAVEQG